MPVEHDGRVYSEEDIPYLLSLVAVPDDSLHEMARTALAETRDCEDCDLPAVWERSDDPETYWYACDNHTGTGLGWQEIKTVRLALAVVAATSPPDAGEITKAARRAAEKIHELECAGYYDPRTGTIENEIAAIITTELANAGTQNKSK